MTLAETDTQIAKAIALLKNDAMGASAVAESERPLEDGAASFHYRAMSNGDDAIEIASLSGRDVDVVETDTWVSFSL